MCRLLFNISTFSATQDNTLILYIITNQYSIIIFDKLCFQILGDFRRSTWKTILLGYLEEFRRKEYFLGYLGDFCCSHPAFFRRNPERLTVIMLATRFFLWKCKQMKTSKFSRNYSPFKLGSHWDNNAVTQQKNCRQIYFLQWDLNAIIFSKFIAQILRD